ncbi:ANTAR domain-containing protein [Kribbella qitaiheensis]|uniref:ANTAR domain-containing protein n=1 Tax=Kribbella qitaiheensis TaxID=1544730 RepID=UPI00360C0E03
MTSAQRYARDRVHHGGMLALADSVLELYSAADPPAVETGVLDLAIRAVPCGFAGLTAARIDAGLAAVSDPVVDEADRLQRGCGEGPRWLPGGLDAVVCVVDTATDARWPQWGQQVAALGLRSMLSVELSARSAGLGALVLYSPDPGWFGTAEQQMAVAVARHASIALASRREESRLRQAMESRALIGKAQGLLMERFGIDADRAFTILRRYSQDHNIKLTEVATSLLSNRDLPSPLRDADGRIHR